MGPKKLVLPARADRDRSATHMQSFIVIAAYAASEEFIIWQA